MHKPLADQPVADLVQQALESDSWQNDLRLVSSRNDWIALDIRCKLSAADRATQFLRELESDLPQQIREDIAAAFRELLLNGIEHGAKGDPRKRVRASILRTERSVIVHTCTTPGRDSRSICCPTRRSRTPMIRRFATSDFRAEHGQRPGGFGILMTRNMVDELLYNECGNSVLFVKYLK